MDVSDLTLDRTQLLAFVERHWRELTLHEARLLCVENIELPDTPR